MKKKIARPADTPAEVYDYWHRRWVEYINQNYKERFFQAGIVGMSFTERCPDCPDGNGAFHYNFASDGELEFVDHEGDAVLEYDSYDIGYRLLGDANFDAMELLAKGNLRFLKNMEHFVKLAELMPLMREAFYAAISDAEKKFNIEMPKYP
ncbi:MAG: hypothetical protein FJZ95_00265 [Chloroflexi bacterium]|nr:hypothetical protein [Chloroflexota bacterium]